MSGPCPACGGAGRAEGARFWRRYRHPRVRRFGGPHKLRKATAPLRSMPDFVVVGAPKCGTTSLYSFLCSHPKVEPALTKEIHYFDQPHKYEMGDLWYRHNFPASVSLRRAGALTGEATTTYLFHPLAPARMSRSAPGAKIIAMLRDPVDRAYSEYHMIMRAGMEYMSFEDALAAEDARTLGERRRAASDPKMRPFYTHNYSYAAKGMYAEQLERWARYYGGRMLVETLEDMRRDPRGVAGRVLEFLGLDPAGALPGKLNEGEYGPMSSSTRKSLAERFAPHNERLYGLLGRDLGWS